MSLRGQSAAPPGTAAAPASGEWLQPLPGHWIEAARAHLSHQAQLVRVTVVALRGSAPREPGASMLVGSQGTVGTIGGGQLEWHAHALARELLDDPGAAPVRLADLILGPDLGQCCGGRVELWLERLTRADLLWLNDAARRLRTGGHIALATDFRAGIASHRLLPSPPGAVRLQRLRRGADAFGLLEALHRYRPALWIFGAGHVGQALVRLLAELALFEITWIDSRAELLPGGWGEVSTRLSDSPALLLPGAPPATRFVVMTHDHGLDYQLCRTILQREDAFWLGLIGSASKSARFRSRLLREGMSAASVSRLHCPIGVPGIPSKLPAAIAIAIAAQLLQQSGSADIAPAAVAASVAVAMPPAGAMPPAVAVPASAAHACAAAGDCGGCGAPREPS
jgi:xanthine dehydrogenase accessory factor